MISDFKPGDSLVAYFVLRRKEIKTKANSDEIYLSLELGDASGRIRGTVWDDVQKHFDALTPGDIVKVKLRVVSLNNRLHLNIDKIRKAGEGDDYDLAALVPVVEKDRGALFAHLDELIASVQNPHLHKLLTNIFTDEALRTQFGNAPAGKLWHHNYLGGLLEHTLSVTDIATTMGQMYPGTNRDLLVAAGLLHDIGKIASYTYETLIDYTDQGRLVGHIVLGAQLVRERIKELEDFPESLATELIHLILSHQGKLEQASPVVPMTLEGLILYYADEMDSKANAFLRIKRKERQPGRKWSSYVSLMNQYFYFGTEE